MNKIYKSIWNEQTGTYVAVSENTKARGKRSSSALLASAILAAVVGTAQAQETITVGNEESFTGNEIIFSSNAGTITGLTSVGLSEDGTNAATTGQVWTVSNDLANLSNTVNDTTTGLSTRASQSDLTALSNAVNDTTTGLSTRASQSDLTALTDVVNDSTTGLSTRAVFVKVVVTVFALKLLVVWQSLSLGLTSLVQPAHNS